MKADFLKIPLSFIKVIGLTSMKDLPWKEILQISALYFDFFVKLIFCDSANLSNSQNPKLCLELKY